MGTSAKPARTFFDAGELRVNASEEPLEGRIARAIRYMALQHTWDEEEINRAIRLDGARELSRVEAAKALDYLYAQGIDIRKGRMMDLGAGLGMVSEEAAA